MHSLAELVPGKVFHGRYEVVRCIRTGGMGAVYEVVHLETRRRRALKVMLPSVVRDAEMRGRFRVEAQITAEVESDHIVETFDAGVDAETGAPFLVMELLRGEDLAHHLEARGCMEKAHVLAVLHQLSRALEQTHARGIVHRDLKPENLFLAVRGDEPPRLKVLDFGIAKMVAQSAQGSGATTNVGTPLYMAPEQFQGADVSPRTDLFAVGHLAFTLLTGHAYFREEAERIGGLLPLIERLSRGAEEPASVRAARRGVELPAAFDEWFAKATARSQDDRFQSAGEQCAALASALSVPLPHTGSAPLAGIVVPPPRPSIGSASPSISGAPTARAPWSADTADAAGASLGAPGAAIASGEADTIAGAPPPEGAAPGSPEPPASMERAAAQTHHTSVTSVPDAQLPGARRIGRTRIAILAAAAFALIAGAAIGVRHFSGGAAQAGARTDGDTTSLARDPAPHAGGDVSPAPGGPVVEPASAELPAQSSAGSAAGNPSAAGSASATGSASTPAAPLSATKTPGTSSARSPSKQPVPATSHTVASPRRDPSKVFE